MNALLIPFLDWKLLFRQLLMSALLQGNGVLSKDIMYEENL